MGTLRAGIAGGLIAGIATSAAMLLGRRAGLLHKTLAEHSEDWLDRRIDARRHLGNTGTALLEQANHLGASAAFGAGYALARPYLPALPAPLLGAAYGAGIYAVAIGGIAPLLGITRGETAEPREVVAQRLGLHLLFGVTLAVAASALSRRD